MSTSKKVVKMAAEDAHNWARAEMFFGEGAGNRRKLLRTAIEHKVQTIPGYGRALEKAYSQQDFADHAIKAAKERKRIDRGQKVGKNARALVRGNKRDLTPVLFAAITIGTILHETGYDKVLLEKAKQRKRRTQLWFDDFTSKGETYSRFIDKTADVIEDWVPMGVVRKMAGTPKPSRGPDGPYTSKR